MLTLNESSLSWALKHLQAFGDTDVVPRAFEFNAIESDWEQVCTFLAKADLHTWTTRPQRTLLAPKSFLGFRVVTQLDPLDSVLFTALVYDVGSDLERNRIPKNKGYVFSHRFTGTPDGALYDPSIGYKMFRDAAEWLTDSARGYTHVAVTDIADFFPRLYSHRLENALSANTKKRDHVTALRRLLAGWNETESHGVPVGPAASRILADVALNDVDQSLMGQSIRFVRFIDDYRLFAKSESEAFRHLAVLAETLYQNHGLTLNPQKTHILTCEDFRRRVLQTPEDVELDNLGLQFQALKQKLKLEDPYATIDIESLTPKLRRELENLNLVALLVAELEKGRVADYSIVRFLLRRLGQLDDSTAVDEVVDRIHEFHPVLPQIVDYLQSLRSLTPGDRAKIGQQLISALGTHFLAELPFYRTWGLDLFATGSEWGNAHRFEGMIKNTTDHFTRRKLILALGRARKAHWFQSRWRALFDEQEWCRRALIYGASCLEKDAYDHWGRSVAPRLNVLEKAVLKFSRANPLR